MLRSLTVIAAFSALLMFSGPALANEQTDLEKGRAAYLARQYEEADARFRAMLNPTRGTLRDAVLITQARMYWGAVLLAKGRPDEAAAIFETLLLADQSFEPDPLSFPTDVIDLFIDTRAKIRDKINAAAQATAKAEAARREREEEARRRQSARIALLERMASEEKIIERHSRLIALVPFGVGQFQNGQPTLGWFFLITESTLATATALTVPFYLEELRLRSAAKLAGDTYTAQAHIDRGNTLFRANLVLAGAFALTAAVGMVQAELDYVPEVVEVRRRAIPQASRAPASRERVGLGSLTPLLAPFAPVPAAGGEPSRGFTLGVSGRF